MKRAPWRGLKMAGRLFGNLLYWPLKKIAAASAWLAPYNPRARRCFREATAAMFAIADDLHRDYAVAHSVNVALVYRLETAHAAMAQALAATRRAQVGPQPDDNRSRMATALLQVVYLAQVAREWQQDSINLRHAISEHNLNDAQRAQLATGVQQLEAYVRQNIADSARWLEAARKLDGNSGKSSARE